MIREEAIFTFHMVEVLAFLYTNELDWHKICPPHLTMALLSDMAFLPDFHVNSSGIFLVYKLLFPFLS